MPQTQTHKTPRTGIRQRLFAYAIWVLPAVTLVMVPWAIGIGGYQLLQSREESDEVVSLHQTAQELQSLTEALKYAMADLKRTRDALANEMEQFDAASRSFLGVPPQADSQAEKPKP